MNEIWNDFKDGFLESFSVLSVHKVNSKEIGVVIGAMVISVLLFLMCVGFFSSVEYFGDMLRHFGGIG